MNSVSEIEQSEEEKTEKLIQKYPKLKPFMLNNCRTSKHDSFMTKSMSNYECSENKDDADFEKKKFNFYPAGYQIPQTRSKKKGGPKNSRSFN